MLSRRKKYRIPTPEGLAAAALNYLGRFAAPEAALRRILLNHLRRAALQHPDFAGNSRAQTELRAAIEAIIEKHKKAGVLNDAAYAEMKTAGFRRAGKSARIIRQKLNQRGLAKAAIDHALHASDGENSEEAELQAALRLVRRRKWGPFRIGETSPERCKKEFAALARAGFSLDVVKQVIDMDDEEIEES